MSRWLEFLDAAALADVAAAFVSDDRPVLAIDEPLPARQNGFALDKKGRRDASGADWRSVVRLALAVPVPMDHPATRGLTGWDDLVHRFRFKVQDASPDSVVGALFFAAQQSGVEIPAPAAQRWEHAVTQWETTGNATMPERSWPALASALAHRHFTGERNVDRSSAAQLGRAWAEVVSFAIESLRQDLDPLDVEPARDGPFLARARAALTEERSRYEHKVLASDIQQLSLPVPGTDRRRLIDGLLTQEEEFGGVLKVHARNDRKLAPLGEGFILLLVERPALRETEPAYWVTISVDPAANVHLFELWQALERMETQAWQEAARERPPRRAGSRHIAGIPDALRHYHEPWFITPDHTLVASPMHQEGGAGDKLDTSPGSLLTAEQVRAAVFRVCDPFARLKVTRDDPRDDARGQGSGETDTIRLVDIPATEIRDVEGDAWSANKRILVAWWPRAAPLPHPSGPRPILPPTILRGMAARTFGIQADRAVLDAPDLQELETVGFGNTLAVLTDGGIFLLETGRGTRSNIASACQLAEAQIKLAHELDESQVEINRLAYRQIEELKGRGSRKRYGAWQKDCAALTARLVRLRGAVDQPLPTAEAGLQPLKDALSRRWNSHARLKELMEAVEPLQQAGKSAEEVRLFHVGRIAAAFAIGILAADALNGPLTTALGFTDDSRWGSILVFVATWLLTVGGAWLTEKLARQQAAAV